MLWSYFRSDHGKGIHDGVGVILMHFIRKEQMRMDNPNLQTTRDVVAMCLHIPNALMECEGINVLEFEEMSTCKFLKLRLQERCPNVLIMSHSLVESTSWQLLGVIYFYFFPSLIRLQVEIKPEMN